MRTYPGKFTAGRLMFRNPCPRNTYCVAIAIAHCLDRPGVRALRAVIAKLQRTPVVEVPTRGTHNYGCPFLLGTDGWLYDCDGGNLRAAIEACGLRVLMVHDTYGAPLARFVRMCKPGERWIVVTDGHLQAVRDGVLLGEEGNYEQVLRAYLVQEGAR